MSVHIGIDPGHSSGGICVLEGNVVWWNKTPSSVDEVLKVCYLVDHYVTSRKADNDPIICFEKVGGRHTDGPSRAFNFGFHCGLLYQGFADRGYQIDLITPRTWQFPLGVFSPTAPDGTKLRGTAKKNYHKEVANDLLKTHYKFNGKLAHWQTDSFLIAYFGRTENAD